MSLLVLRDAACPSFLLIDCGVNRSVAYYNANNIFDIELFDVKIYTFPNAFS